MWAKQFYIFYRRRVRVCEKVSAGGRDGGGVFQDVNEVNVSSREALKCKSELHSIGRTPSGLQKN